MSIHDAGYTIKSVIIELCGIQENVGGWVQFLVAPNFSLEYTVCTYGLVVSLTVGQSLFLVVSAALEWLLTVGTHKVLCTSV